MNQNKSARYMQRMIDMGMTQVRLLLPAEMAEDYRDRAMADRADYLQRLAEDAADDDPRLALLAGMNNTKPLTAQELAKITEGCKNTQRAAKLCNDMDAVQAALWAALRDADMADTPSRALRAQARASVASLDYRRLREELENC